MSSVSQSRQQEKTGSEIWASEKKYNSKGYQSQDSAMIKKPEVLHSNPISRGLNEKLNAQ